MINTRHALRIVVMCIGITGLVVPSEHALALHTDSPQTREYIDEWKKAALSRAEDREQALRSMAVEFKKDINARIENSQTPTPATDRSQATANANENSAVMRSEETEQSPTPRNQLSDKRLKACQNREIAIKNIMTNLADKSAHQLDVFTKIANRSMKFYESKDDTSSSSYADLVAKMQTQRVVAEDAVAATHDASYLFNCEDGNPTDTAAAFTEQIRLQNDLLNQYKSAVKSLVIEIRNTTSEETI